MNIDSRLASSYPPFVPSNVHANAHVFNQPIVVNPARERAPGATTAIVGPNLPERCFGVDRQLPQWLMRPWYQLQRATKRRRLLSTRLADLSQVAKSLDELFANHLPTGASWFQSTEAAGLSISEHLPRWVDELIGEATTLFLHQLRPELVAEGIYVRSVAQLDEWQRDWLHQHFMQRIYPLLTPLAVDPGRPFPYISSDSLNLLVELHRVDGEHSGNFVDRNSLFARVKVPRATPRLVAVPTQPHSTFAPTIYVCSADLVRYFVHHLFTGMPVRNVYLFRLVRGEQPLPGVNPMTATRPRRQEDKPVVRLEVEQRMVAPVLHWLMEHLRLPHYALAQHDHLFEWSCLPYLAEHAASAQSQG